MSLQTLSGMSSITGTNPIVAASMASHDPAVGAFVYEARQHIAALVTTMGALEISPIGVPAVVEFHQVAPLSLHLVCSLCLLNPALGNISVYYIARTSEEP